MGDEEEDEGVFLDDCWTLYFHDPDDAAWTQDSYKQLGNVSTVHDWIHAELAFGSFWSKGMFFLMREHILPLWEDSYNKNGGCLSYKVNKPDVARVWCKLCAQVLGNTLVDNSDIVPHDAVCGVSISPKRSYCILRIWIGSCDHGKPELYKLDAPEYTQVLWKTHEKNTDFITEQVTPT